MTVKLTGAEWKKFIEDDDPEFWGDSVWIEGELLTVNGDEVDSLGVDAPNNAAMKLSGGVVYDGDREWCSVEAHFRRWRKKQATVVFVVEAPREKADAVRAAIAAAGGVVK